MRQVAPGSVVERASIDEAYVDIGDHVASVLQARDLEQQTDEDENSPVAVAEWTARRILGCITESNLDLPVSIGVGPNKFVAKLASTEAKAARDSSEAGGVR